MFKRSWNETELSSAAEIVLQQLDLNTQHSLHPITTKYCQEICKLKCLSELRWCD